MLEVIFLTSSVLTLVTGLIIVVINPWRMINRSYLVAAGLSSSWLFCIFMAIHRGNAPAGITPSEVLLWIRLSNATAAFLPWAYFLIKESILLETKSTAVILKRSWPWAAISCLLALLVFSEFFITSTSIAGLHKRGTGYTVYLAALAVLCALILYDALKGMRKCQGVSRLEIKFFAINFCLATLAVLLMFYMSGVLQMPLLRYMGPFVVVLSFSLTIWAVCYYRVFDAQQILLSAGQRVFLPGLLGTCAVGLARAVEPIIQPPYGVLLATILACLLAVHLDRPTKKWLGLDPVHLLQRSRQTIIDWARRESDEERLRIRFAQYLAQWCQADDVMLLASQNGHFTGSGITLPADWHGLDFVSKEGWITPEALQRQRETPGTGICLDFLLRHRLGALLAVPKGSPTPSLLIALGHRHSLRPYTYPDIQLLLELAELMDNILTHSRIAARMAHDLNNLATPVSSFLVHMESRVLPGTPEAEVLADAKHSIRVMQDYIGESLFFARRLVPDFQNLSPAELLASTVKVTQARAQARDVHVVIGDTADVLFHADRALMQRLLQNLVFNGIDATPRGGQVILSVAADGRDRISFSVADQGPGVPIEIMDRIFEPYFTTKDTGNEIRGLGLGLAICLKIGDLHRGALTVGRAPCGGALFTAGLPLDPRSPA